MSNGIDPKCVSPVERSDLMCSCESSAGERKASVCDVRERRGKFFFEVFLSPVPEFVECETIEILMRTRNFNSFALAFTLVWEKVL